jgi:hypothetical protein
MANVKKGNLTPPPQWWKHLRDWKRFFWKRERVAQKKEINKEATNQRLQIGDRVRIKDNYPDVKFRGFVGTIYEIGYHGPQDGMVMLDNLYWWLDPSLVTKLV